MFLFPTQDIRVSLNDAVDAKKVAPLIGRKELPARRGSRQELSTNREKAADWLHYPYYGEFVNTNLLKNFFGGEKVISK
jgi:hypothetical protein